MPKGSELTEADRGKILGLRTGGSSISKISKTFKIPPSTVRDTIVRYMNSDNLKSARRSGRHCSERGMVTNFSSNIFQFD